jgi:hypothetical protein
LTAAVDAALAAYQAAYWQGDRNGDMRQAMAAALEAGDEVRYWKSSTGLAESRIATLRAENEALRATVAQRTADLASAVEALEPFAVRSANLHSGYDDGMAAGDQPHASVFVSDLRRAATALASLRQPPSPVTHNAEDRNG